jgi:hypothetical protein
MVQNGKFAASAPACDTALNSVDLPTFGSPTRPTWSATGASRGGEGRVRDRGADTPGRPASVAASAVAPRTFVVACPPPVSGRCGLTAVGAPRGGPPALVASAPSPEDVRRAGASRRRPLLGHLRGPAVVDADLGGPPADGQGRRLRRHPRRRRGLQAGELDERAEHARRAGRALGGDQPEGRDASRSSSRRSCRHDRRARHRTRAHPRRGREGAAGPARRPPGSPRGRA